MLHNSRKELHHSRISEKCRLVACEFFLLYYTNVRLISGRSSGVKIMMILITTNSSHLRSLAFKRPVKNGLFIEINHNWENKPHLITTNSSHLRSLAFKRPVKNGLFIEINHNWENKPHLIITNSSLLRSLAFKSPVRDGLFIEINHNWENKPHSGRPVNEYQIKSIVYFTFRKF